ncbi:hypothetical protein F9U64_03740 [Gracilibacillus oryzae]|uniref:Flagellar hook-length control protein-like C-terminal domain-containing protein n=1 Tax=Gracilibacillus oryzae TaxID=1672701 RepID=A0A7C8GV87_9BACI|nr:flagellar hook-length control protein FliK [Gracilibacillus oryzae]KAB8138740.1 hypothetical protein F9U64_03740 [Gracilibacillus oryzae]
MFVGANFIANMTANQTLHHAGNTTSSNNDFQQLLEGVTEHQGDGTIRSLVSNQTESNLTAGLESIIPNASEETMELLRSLISGEELSEESVQQLADLLGTEEDGANEELLDIIQQLLNVPDQSEFTESLKGLEKLLTDKELTSEELIAQLQDLFSNKAAEESVIPIFSGISTARLQVNALNPEISKVDQQEFAALWQKVDRLINKLENLPLTAKDYKQLTNLIQQWSQLSQQDSATLSSFLTNIDDSKTKNIWTKLVENYQNRLSAEKLYGQTQQVTKQDIAKWIQSALENYETIVKPENGLARAELLQLSNQSAQHKVQQFVIHVQQTNTEGQVAQKQLLEQFQLAIQKSSFLKSPNGTNQLMLRLQPGNLGDVMVKLTQVNGEMIVKMVVQSQAAKDLLEGNINQLRHMFSPQQVVIEKQESILTQTSQDRLWKDESDASNNQEKQNSDDQAGQHSDSEQERETSTFHDLLMDMKV